jgi:ADP-ribosylglycohydrolase/catechol 2,3-dioxygenase-like lactoylglutathione lyase family enzyme
MVNDITINFKMSKVVGALLGAAYGDALGWPNERRDKTKVAKPLQARLHEFRKWSRRSGGRFFPHEEIIKEGEYSDDTQLMLCICRSLSRGGVWWDYFTQVELPFWSAYERGGGGATKRAVDAWLDGVAPWSPNRKSQDIKRYFDAGGNGVAMRILPHVLFLGEKDFPEIALNIFLDGVATHGHPRALLGALVYGFALWTAFRKDSKLAYGELVEVLINKVDIWSTIPNFKSILPEWGRQAERNLQNYTNVWELTKIEIMKSLDICQSELAKGALSFDDEVLKKLECFNTKISGAGTVAAMAALYLSSRHAADPISGVVKAAFALGSDTDTIASMTGGLLGCVNGSDWLSSVKQGIQDVSYIEKCASSLSSGVVRSDASFEPIRKNTFKKWIEEAVAVPESQDCRMLDGRKGKVNWGVDQVGRTGKYKIQFRKIIFEDGQKIYINKIIKGDFGGKKVEQASLNDFNNHIVKTRAESLQPLDNLCFGPKLPVSNLDKALRFYKELLGLTIKRKTQDVVVFNQGLVLTDSSYAKDFPGMDFRTLLYAEVVDIPIKFQDVRNNGVTVVTHLGFWKQSNRRFFRCLDPDGNLVEVFENK